MSTLVPPVPVPRDHHTDASGAPGSQRRLQQTKAQVEEVVDMVRLNVDKMLEREHKLSQLDQRVEVLQASTSQFRSTARKVKRKYWWKNCKMLLVLITVIVLIIMVIVIWYTT